MKSIEKTTKKKYKIKKKYPESRNYKTDKVVDGIAIYPKEIKRIAKEIKVPEKLVRDGVLLHEYIHKKYPTLNEQEFTEKFKELYRDYYPKIKKEYFEKIVNYSGHFSEANKKIYNKYGRIKVIHPELKDRENNNPNNPISEEDVIEVKKWLDKIRKKHKIKGFIPDEIVLEELAKEARKRSNPENPSETKGIELGLGNPDVIDLRDLKEEQPEKYKKLKKVWEEETGYDLDEYVDNEPVIKTKEALEEEYLELSGIDEKLKYYLDVDAMIDDDYMSGYLRTITIDGVKYYYRIY